MTEIITTVIEEAPKGVYLISRWSENKDGHLVHYADIEKPFKKMNMFDSEGNMTVKYYLEDEWNDTNLDPQIERPRSTYKPDKMFPWNFIYYLNFQLQNVYLEEIYRDFYKFDLIKAADLSPASEKLLDAIYEWRNTEPFQFGGLCVQQHQDDNGIWSIDYFYWPNDR